MDDRYYYHYLGLRPGADALFRQFYQDCIQRRIRHSKRLGVTISEGRGDSALGEFYSLVVQTRRRPAAPTDGMISQL
jgi:hypothetical protein